MLCWLKWNLSKGMSADDEEAWRQASSSYTSNTGKEGGAISALLNITVMTSGVSCWHNFYELLPSNESLYYNMARDQLFHIEKILIHVLGS